MNITTESHHLVITTNVNAQKSILDALWPCAMTWSLDKPQYLIFARVTDADGTSWKLRAAGDNSDVLHAACAYSIAVARDEIRMDGGQKPTTPEEYIGFYRRLMKDADAGACTAHSSIPLLFRVTIKAEAWPTRRYASWLIDRGISAVRVTEDPDRWTLDLIVRESGDERDQDLYAITQLAGSAQVAFGHCAVIVLPDTSAAFDALVTERLAGRPTTGSLF